MFDVGRSWSKKGKQCQDPRKNNHRLLIPALLSKIIWKDKTDKKPGQ
jgi:hypothetical protein